MKKNTPMVRRSTLIVSVMMALAVGLYIGTLVPALTGSSRPVTQVSGQSAGQEAVSEHIRQAEEAVQKAPNNASAWTHLGNLYFDEGMPEKSVLAYTRSLAINPNNPNVLTDRGTMYRALKKYDLALESFQKASALDAKHQNSLFNAGIVLYFDLGRKDEGRRAFEAVLTLNPAAKAPNGQSVREFLQGLQ